MVVTWYLLFFFGLWFFGRFGLLFGLWFFLRLGLFGLGLLLGLWGLRRLGFFGRARLGRFLFRALLFQRLRIRWRLLGKEKKGLKRSRVVAAELEGDGVGWGGGWWKEVLAPRINGEKVVQSDQVLPIASHKSTQNRGKFRV